MFELAPGVAPRRPRGNMLQLFVCFGLFERRVEIIPRRFIQVHSRLMKAATSLAIPQFCARQKFNHVVKECNDKLNLTSASI